MADKSISELTPVTTVNSEDSFVLQQNNRAMRLTGQILLNWLAPALDGHGGINNIAKTSSSGLTDIYTITYADQTTTTFTVDNGKSISSIAKTGTANLVDTYTITFNDSSTQTYTVTNGKGISNIAKTSTSGLVDTYTITYNDSTTDTFTVTNGNGISDIQKSSSGLQDTYTITYTNGTTFQFSVDNGVGITDISKTSTSGLVDTYTITYNSGATTTFTVTNGEKGDKGDNTYTFVKYSENQPTQDSDMKDAPDNWMGIYTGSSSTAPTAYTSYSWFKIKGEKGDTGSATTITSTSVQYASSDSATVPPSSWQNSIPTVPQTYFLWTKTEVVYSTGDQTVSYTASRQGRDGAGSVSSVQGQSPDATGNVQLYEVSGTTLILK